MPKKILLQNKIQLQYDSSFSQSSQCLHDTPAFPISLFSSFALLLAVALKWPDMPASWKSFSLLCSCLSAASVIHTLNELPISLTSRSSGTPRTILICILIWCSDINCVLSVSINDSICHVELLTAKDKNVRFPRKRLTGWWKTSWRDRR